MIGTNFWCKVLGFTILIGIRAGASLKEANHILMTTDLRKNFYLNGRNLNIPAQRFCNIVAKFSPSPKPLFSDSRRRIVQSIYEKQAALQ